MQEILAITLNSMHQDMARLERVGMNLANTLTPGYKREVVAARPFFHMFANLVANSADSGVVANGGGVTTGPSALIIQTDTRPGTLKSTGQSLDVALAGSGYFEIATDQGPAYTRQGNFRVDARGRLVTAQGYPVMGKGGEIFLSTGSPVIDEKGNVFDGQSSASGAALQTGAQVNTPPLAQLKVVQFENPKTLQRMGDGLVAGGDNFGTMNEADIQIRQGFLENSNVSSMQEMVQLVQTMRHFESMQKVALGYDEMMGAAIRKLGELS